MVFWHFIWKSQIWWGIRAVSNPQSSKRFLFTSDCSKHCIMFISASHGLLCESKTTQRKMPSPGSGYPDSPLLFYFLPLLLLFPLLWDHWSRCNTYYRGFQDLRISRRWLEINLHNPPRSVSSPSLSFSSLFNLGKTAGKGVPRERRHGHLKRGQDRGEGGG